MIHQGDCRTILSELPERSIHCCVTSPPYWGIRDYGVEGQLGLESTPEEYVSKMVEVFREVKRVLRDDGTLWLNLGDSYASTSKGTGGKKSLSGGGLLRPSGRSQPQMEAYKLDYGALPIKTKDLVGIPWRVAFALQADGWYLRQDIIWHKPNPMPESVRDRCTKAHEYIFLLSKSAKYYFDSEAIREKSVSKGTPNSPKSIKSPYGQGFTRRATKVHGKDLTNACGDSVDGYRNRRSVWTVTTKPFKGAHFASFPPDLIEPCILAGSSPCQTVLDPFFGAGTVGLVALKHGREFIGIELNPEYVKLAHNRLQVCEAVI